MPGGDLLAAFGKFNPMQSGEAAPAKGQTTHPAPPVNPAAALAALSDLLMQAIMSGAGFPAGTFAAG